VKQGGLVLVFGATGGVGQLVVARLLEQGYRVKAVVRSVEKAQALFGDAKGLVLVEGDVRNEAQLRASGACDAADACVMAVGTTAFPSARWADDNGPRKLDGIGSQNIIESVRRLSPRLARFVLVSSIGTTRTGQMPFLLLNLFSVLTFKSIGEQALIDSGLPYTILRPGRLTDGPYTSYDLNTLLRATSGTRRRPMLALDDSSIPQESSRLVVAAAAVAALQSDFAVGKAFDVGSSEGDGPPESSKEDWLAGWDQLFTSAKRQ